MTGEITLRGQVLPVGGIKEKILAAHRNGLRTVILPKRNEPDLEDVPDEIKEAMKFVFADNVDDVLNAALEIPLKGSDRKDGKKKSARSKTTKKKATVNGKKGNARRR
jgi:ATP-dependent Lon protease